MRAAKPVVCSDVLGCVAGACWVRHAGALAGTKHCGQYFCLRVWVFPGSCCGPVHGCPWDRPIGSLRPRTYSGQRRHAETGPVMFAQVNGYVAWRQILPPSQFRGHLSRCHARNQPYSAGGSRLRTKRSSL
jgi:hypothetical protein